MPFRIENRVGVAAPASLVWDIVSDLDRWPEWNALYPQASGRLLIGETLTLTLAVPGEKPETIKPIVNDWVPNEQVVWNVKLGGGLLRTTRYFEMDALHDAACIFANGEIFEGLGARVVPRRLRSRIRQGFYDLGEAVKFRAEARWAAQRP